MVTTKKRIQISLNDDLYKTLIEESKRLGVTKSNLIALLLDKHKKQTTQVAKGK
jgi:hypothetical protein